MPGRTHNANQQGDERCEPEMRRRESTYPEVGDNGSN